LLLPQEVLSAAAMLLKALEYGTWVLSSFLLLATAVQIWRKGNLSHLRVFFIYLLVVGTHTLLNLCLRFTNDVWWFYSFFIGSVITTLLGFAVLYEVAKNVISLPAFKLNASTFLTLCATSAVIAVLVTANTGVAGTSFVRARILFEVALRVMQVCILAIFAATSIFLGLFWQRVEFGIVLGYGLYAASQLAVMYLRAAGLSNTVSFIVPLISYCCAAMIWFVYSTRVDSVIEGDVEPLLSEIHVSRAVLERLR
jgi:hypothetical protein